VPVEPESAVHRVDHSSAAIREFAIPWHTLGGHTLWIVGRGAGHAARPATGR